jgi:hypothetical protein
MVSTNEEFPLSELFRSFSVPLSYDDLVNWLSRRDKRNIYRLLLKIAEDSKLSAQIARRSYLHPNGFAKLRLYRSLHGKWQLRLHVWPSEAAAARALGDIHDHRWTFQSWVLAGALQERVFRSIDGNGHAKLMYEPASQSNHKRLYEVGSVRLEQVEELNHEPDTGHGGDANWIHQFGPVRQQLCATLVVIGPPARAYSHVYRDTWNDGTPQVIRPPVVDSMNIQDIIRHVLIEADF